jgi:ribosomal protein S18 acetylase RimI-like enzyme
VAAIIDIAGHGIDMDYWNKDREPDHSILAAARRLVLRHSGLAYHYREIAGGLIGNLVEAEAQESNTSYITPLQILENRFPGYWSFIAIATYEEFRGKGLATELLEHGLDLARKANAIGASIVVENTNAAAIKIYDRMGFGLRESRKWLSYGDRTGPTDWLLMAREL